MRASEIADLCGGKTKIKGNAIVVSCPCCQPNGPKNRGSGGHLHIEDKNDGWAHVSCLMRCPEESILTALGLTQDDRRHETKATPETRRRIEAVAVTSGLSLPEPTWTKYRPDKLASRDDYTSVSGAYAFSKVRLANPDNPKDFRCIVIDEPNDRWAWTLEHLNGSADVLYNYPRVIQALINGETIYINEGEKACNRMAAEGLVATCQRAGADPQGSKWLPIHTAMLAGAKEIVIVADLDPDSEHDHLHQVGQRYAAAVCAKLKDARLRARVVTSKTTGSKDDAYDHFEAGFTAAEFIPRPDLMPSRGLTSSLVIAYETNPQPVKFLFGQHIRTAQMTLLDADGGTGKTTFGIALAASLSNGFDPFNRAERSPGRTLLFAAEDGTEDIGTLYAAMGGVRGALLHYAEPFTINNASLELLRETIEDGQIELVIFDPLFAVLGVKDFNDAAAITPALQSLREIAKETGAAFLNVRHTNRSAANATDHRADVGIGSAMIRNAHREVLRVRFHPDHEKHKGLRVVTAHKGSLRHEDGEPLGFRRVGDAIEWVHDPDMAAFETQGFQLASTKESAAAWLKAYLGEYGHFQTEIKAAADAAGIAWRTVERAKKELGVVSYRPTIPGEWCWKLPTSESNYSPFTDD